MTVLILLELVPPRGEKQFQATSTNQDIGTSKNFSLEPQCTINGQHS